MNKAAGLLVALLFCFSSGCSFQTGSNQNSDPAAPSAEEFPLSSSNIDLAKPLEVSSRPDDVELCRKINQTIDSSEFANARWGVFAVGLKDGRISCARDAQKLFNPASIQKLMTSVVALDKLGTDFRWKTRLLSAKAIEPDGTLNGDLVLYGGGAPDFDSDSLDKLAAMLQAKGLKRIKGSIIGDDSFFKGDSIGDGWAWNEIQWYYGAEASALTYNDNQAEVKLSGGKPVASDEYVEVSGEIKPKEDIEAIGVKRGLGDNKVYVWGNGSELDARLAVQNPALWAARALKEALKKKGIAVDGEAKSADWKSGERIDPENAVELVAIESRALAEIVRKMNKDSVNLYAELILRTLGKKSGQEAPDENPRMQKLRGDDSAGATMIEKWLRDNNVSANEIQVHDGSGLSRLDFVTPESLGRVLIYAAQSKFAKTFKDSLPVAGVDGTLKGRLKNVSGKVLGKTGSITYVNSLAGYANSTKGETFAFVIICNNETRKNDSSPILDSIASALVQN